MNKEKALKKTLKKLKQQRDSAQCGAERLMLNGNELRLELTRLDVQLQLTIDQCDEARRSRDEALQDAIEEHVARVEDVDALQVFKVAFQNLMAVIDRDGGHAQTGDAKVDGERGEKKVLELLQFSEENKVRALQKRLARKAEELRLALVELEKLKRKPLLDRTALGLPPDVNGYAPPYPSEDSKEP